VSETGSKGAGINAAWKRARWALMFAAILCAAVVFGVGQAVADEDLERAPSWHPTLQDIEDAPWQPLPSQATDLEAARELPHDELDRGEAEELLTSVFPGEVEPSEGALEGSEVERYLSETEALVRPDGGLGAPALLESSLPLQAEDEEGDEAPVDLSLEPTEGGLQPANPLVEVGVPSDLAEGIVLPEVGVTVGLAGGEGSLQASTIEEGSAAFYPNVAEDTDLTVAPNSVGFETMTQLRTAEAPRTQTFEIGLEPGQTLKESDDGGAEVLAEGKTVMSVESPSAIDAAGEPIPAKMTTSGDSLTITVEPGEEAAYPILVDPIYDVYSWGQYGGGPPSFVSWIPYSNNPAFSAAIANSGYWGLALHSESGPTQTLAQSRWDWQVPRLQQEAPVRPTSFISTAYLSDFRFNTFAAANGGNVTVDPFVEIYLWDEYTGFVSAPYKHYGTEGDIGSSGAFGLTGNGDPNAKQLTFELVTTSPGTQYRDAFLGWAEIEMSDNDSPVLTGTGDPAGWVNNSPTVHLPFSAEDTGLGVYAMNLGVQTTAGFTTIVTRDNGCTGGSAAPCPRNWSSGGGPQVTYDPSQMPQGEDQVLIGATDPLGHASSVATETLKVDHTKPALTATGTYGEKGSPAQPAYTVKYKASDGTAAAPQSGVASLQVKVDGKVERALTPGCATKNCEISGELTLEASKFGTGTHTVEVLASDGVSLPATPVTLSFSLERPDTVIDSGPQGLTNQSSPKFTYHSVPTGSTFSCSIDGGAFSSCASVGYTTGKLSDGNHTFSVRATNAFGISDATPATRTFTVDTTPPETTIDYGPEGTIANPTPAFGYSSDDPAADFQCRVDSASFEGCGFQSERLRRLSDGSHNFAVRAVDRAGNVDPSPATRTFTVDATAPEVTILTGPSGPTMNAKPKFTFEASGQSKLQCALGLAGSEPGWRTCTGSGFDEPSASLVDGSYIFRVEATDSAGNEAEDSRVFAVDRQAPDTTITAGPNGTTDDAKPSFSFRSNEPGSTFACRFDVEAFRACAGPGATDAPKTALADGSHSFEVRATDPAGNMDGSPAKRTFTVFAAAPETKITGGPEGPTTNTTPTFTYAADETATFECRVDSAAFASCPGAGKELGAQPEGEHVFEVRARNAAGVDPTPARRAFIVDTTNPDAPALSGEVFTEPGPNGLQLNIQARDGNRSTPASTRSGVEAATLTIDGQQAVTLRNRCSAMGCPDTMRREYQVSPYKASGAHEYKVMIRDELGHERVAQWARNMPQSTLLKSRVSPEASCDGKVIHVFAKHYVGKDCAEMLVVESGVESVNAMGGNDFILGGPGEETLKGGEGDDLIRGARSNDEILGEGGDDYLYGGIGDDTMKGGAGNDVIDGGPGADHEFGEADDDVLRGGQGKDTLKGGSQGPKGDTVSFADAVAPGFKLDGTTTAAGVSGQTEGTTGVFVKVKDSGDEDHHQPAIWEADNGPVAEERGGVDEFSEMENIVGSAFDDVIERPGSGIHVFAGPGADIVTGGGKENVDAGSGDNSVEGEGDNSISHPAPVEFGVQNPTPGEAETDLYLSGSAKSEKVEVIVSPKSAQFVFKVAPGVEAQGCSGGPTTFNCSLNGGLGAVVLAGYAGEDELAIKGRKEFSKGSVTLAGGPDRDTLDGGAAEDVLIDGSGQGSSGQPERLVGMSGDDVLLQGDGKDVLNAGAGNDLLVSSQVCGDELIGGPGGDNAQFHPFASGSGVFADLESGDLGERGGDQDCSSLSGIEDLEGSPEADIFRGTTKNNLLLGRGGRDVLIGRGGGDHINAKDRALDNTVDCSNDKTTIVQADPGIEITAGERRQGKLKSVFRNCEPRQIRTNGPTYDDENGQVNAAMLASVPPPTPARLSRLQGAAAPEPPESPGVELETEAALASYVALDDTEGVSATDFTGGDGGTYEAAGQGPSVNGPGPQLGAGGALKEAQGSAVVLDGVDDLISLADQMGLEEARQQSGFSVEMLVKFSKAPGTKEYLYSSGSGGEGLFLSRAANGVITLATGGDVGAPQVSSYSAVSDNAWHQIVAVVEEHTLTLYIDGMRSRVGFDEKVVTPEEAEATTTTTIGTGPGQVDFLAATVDEFSTYLGSLSEAEVQSHLEETIVTEPAEVLVPAPEVLDTDGDGVADGVDNCPSVANADQADVNNDGIGDACLMPDIDSDGVEDAADNCPEAVNPDQADANADGVGDACGESPPVVTSGEAAGIQAESATLKGTVAPGGTATTYKFEYGTTIAYGKSVPVPAASLSSGRAVIAVSQTPAGLSPQSTYHYRLVAENSFGRTLGEDRTFTTLKQPIGEQLAKMPVTEPFDGSAASVSNFGANWTALSWTGKKGEDSKTGWRAIDAFPTANGIFYGKSVATSANGIAVAATLSGAPTILERFFSLWLGMPTPTSSPRAGYELRFTETATANAYTVSLGSWTAGTKTVLAQKSSYTLAPGSQFALVAKGGTVSVWVGSGGVYTELLSAKSSTFASGYSGLEAAGNITRISNFRTGSLS
jgi:Ca2+-binding RTX toxin-like protein